MIKNLIFDLDGTLVATDKANFVAYQKAFKDLGIALNKNIFNMNNGLEYTEMIKKVAPSLSTDKYIELKELKHNYYKENVHLMSLNTNLINFIKHIACECKNVVVTSASKKNAEFILKYFKIYSLFDFFIYAEDVPIGKPNPACYEMALKLLNSTPENCLAFEDSENGLAAAKAAGITSIKVKYV